MRIDRCFFKKLKSGIGPLDLRGTIGSGTVMMERSSQGSPTINEYLSEIKNSVLQSYMATQIIFYNGQWYPADAKPDFLNVEAFAYNHALHYASTVFEGVRCYPNRGKKGGGLNLLGVDLRIDRMFRSLEYTWMQLPPNPEQTWKDFSERFPELVKKYEAVLKPKLDRKKTVLFPYSKSQVKAFIIEAVERNLKTGFLRPEEGCYIRPLVFRGTTPTKNLGVFSLGHSVDFLISVKPWGKYLGAEAFEKGAPVVVAEEGNEEYNRQHKLSANYLTGQRLVNFASYNSFNEVLLTDRSPKRHVLEGSGENLIFYLGKSRYASPAQTNKPVLPGTTLKVVDQIVRLLGGEVVYRDIPIQEILDGKFLGAAMTGTAAEITPISLVFDPKTKRAVEIPMAKEIKELQKTYLDLAHGLVVDPRLQNLQKELLLEVR